MTVSNKQTLGTLNGSALVVDIGAGVGSHAPVKVVLSQPLVHSLPPGFPTPPDQTGAEVSKKTNTFSNGATITTFPAVATAIKTAGGGS